METNPYEYDKSVPWIPQQNQLNERTYVTARTNQQPPVPQNSRLPHSNVVQKPKTAERMPKARALALADTLKKWLVATSMVAFVSLSGLVASHQIGTTTTSTSSGSSQATPATNSSSTNSSSQSSNGFFNQQGGNYFGSSNSSQSPVSGSSVS